MNQTQPANHAVKDSRALSHAFDELGGAVHRLSITLDSMETRLQPMLEPERPSPEVPRAALAEAATQQAEMVERLLGTVARIQELNAHYDDVLRRLAI